MKIAVSILSSNYSEEQTIKRINNTNAQFVHVDVMDGNFVIQKTEDYEYLTLSNKPLQVHLMVSNPFMYVEKYALPNTYSITFPSELTEDIDGLLQFIKCKNIKCGLALNPETSVNRILPYIHELDEVIVMSVNPGMGGQKMMDEVLYKIDELNNIKREKNLDFEIVVDGGVNDKTISKVRNADTVVSGSFICKSDDFNKQIEKLNMA